jgi:hypothetical protein
MKQLVRTKFLLPYVFGGSITGCIVVLVLSIWYHFRQERKRKAALLAEFQQVPLLTAAASSTEVLEAPRKGVFSVLPSGPTEAGQL